jgi:hypothetical protein
MAVVGVPLLAVTVLRASTFAVAALTAAGYRPWLVIGLPAGAWTGRLPAGQEVKPSLGYRVSAARLKPQDGDRRRPFGLPFRDGHLDQDPFRPGVAEKFLDYLVDPTGSVVATASTPNTTAGRPPGTATLTAPSPVAGTWEIDVELGLTVSGSEFTQTVNGTVSDSG